MKRFTVFMFIFIIIMFGLLVLQIFLSRAKNKFLGLIIPAVTLIYSFIATFGNMIYDGKNTLSIVVVFIVFNIPTFILLAVYGATKSGMKKAEQAEKEKTKMNIKDFLCKEYPRGDILWLINRKTAEKQY